MDRGAWWATVHRVTKDRVALISPSYFTPMENVEKTVDVLRSWGLEPVVGPNVGKVVDGKYAGTVAERVSDIRWALSDRSIKAIICNRGGYGTIQLIDQLTLAELKTSPKWLVGFSDITDLLDASGAETALECACDDQLSTLYLKSAGADVRACEDVLVRGVLGVDLDDGHVAVSDTVADLPLHMLPCGSHYGCRVNVDSLLGSELYDGNELVDDPQLVTVGSAERLQVG